MVEVEEHQMKWRAKENSKNKLGALLVVESSSFRYEKSRCWGWGLGVVLRAKVALQKAKLRGLYSAESSARHAGREIRKDQDCLAEEWTTEKLSELACVSARPRNGPNVTGVSLSRKWFKK